MFPFDSSCCFFFENNTKLIKTGLVYFQIVTLLFFIDSLIEEGGDWDRRNRLKVYQGLYCVAIRDFKQAAELFLDTVSTFTSYELMDYKTFVTYTVYVSMIALERPDLREKVTTESLILLFKNYSLLF